MPLFNSTTAHVQQSNQIEFRNSIQKQNSEVELRNTVELKNRTQNLTKLS